MIFQRGVELRRQSENEFSVHVQDDTGRWRQICQAVVNHNDSGEVLLWSGDRDNSHRGRVVTASRFPCTNFQGDKLL